MTDEPSKFLKLLLKKVISYSTLLCAYVKADMLDAAFNVLSRMRSQGLFFQQLSIEMAEIVRSNLKSLHIWQ